MRCATTIFLLLAAVNQVFGDVESDLKQVLADRTARVEKAQAEFDK